MPRQLRFQPSLPFTHVGELGRGMSDGEIWEYARLQELVIVTKDTDFSNRIMFNTPPPWVAHLRPPRTESGTASREAVLFRGWRGQSCWLPTFRHVPAGAWPGHPNDPGTAGLSGCEFHHDRHPSAESWPSAPAAPRTNAMDRPWLPKTSLRCLLSVTPDRFGSCGSRTSKIAWPWFTETIKEELDAHEEPFLGLVVKPDKVLCLTPLSMTE
ncbi:MULTISPECIES: DUF5615 family PIN-like protein [unclassified Synechococcus]|uniref:DUF5615 family PIN-like protein n=1 Tax=unclassified Synechococcus TaxID=2626047 RepID=UPI0037D9DD93